MSEISSPHIIQPNNISQAVKQHYQVQQQPIIKPPILPPKASFAVNNSSTTGAVVSDAGNLLLLQQQQQKRPPYIAPPYYENIQDVATSGKPFVILSLVLQIVNMLIIYALSYES